MNLELKKRILESGLKQRFIAAKAEMNPVRLSRIVHKDVIPNPEEKKALAIVLNTSVQDIFNDNEC